MALSNLDPVTREETILNGDEITPATRREYFLQKAVNKVPTPDGAEDAGKVPTVNSAGDGFTLETPAGGGGVTYVNLTYDDVADDGSYISDVTVDAAIAALTAGNIVIVIVEGVKALCGHIHNSENPNPCAYVNWLNFDGTNMDLYYRQFVGVSGNIWRFIGGTVELTPET